MNCLDRQRKKENTYHPFKTILRSFMLHAILMFDLSICCHSQVRFVLVLQEWCQIMDTALTILVLCSSESTCEMFDALHVFLRTVSILHLIPSSLKTYSSHVTAKTFSSNAVYSSWCLKRIPISCIQCSLSVSYWRLSKDDLHQSTYTFVYSCISVQSTSLVLIYQIITHTLFAHV